MKWRSDRRVLPLPVAQYAQYDSIHRLTFKKLGRFPELIDCRDFNDKIQWLKLFDKRKLAVECTDKILMRNYVARRLGPGYTPKLYQTCENFDEIDFEVLPKSFVVKTNHDSGSVFLVSDKNKLNKPAIRMAIQSSLQRCYGHFKGEWAYSYIKPRVLVEEFIAVESKSTPPDYKFHCVDGKVKWLQYIFDRGIGTKEVIIDTEGRVTGIHLDTNMEQSSLFIKPANWEQMKGLVERLAGGWKYIRVDVYNVERGTYVGELTFFPLSGCYLGRGQRELGDLLDFDRSTFQCSAKWKESALEEAT